MVSLPRSDVFDKLDAVMKERVVIIDGAMGTNIQAYKLEEADFRGEKWKDHTHDLKGDNDLLVVTRPDVIMEIHNGFLEAGADIIETNSFNGTSISQADYELDQKENVFLINKCSAEIAKKCTTEWTAKTPDKPRFVAGAIGPTNRTLSVSPSVENPAFRNCTFDEVVQAYYEQADCCPQEQTIFGMQVSIQWTSARLQALRRHAASERCI
jgi:5-methyltetrahydrofolate--homocysteine methyltransferase